MDLKQIQEVSVTVLILLFIFSMNADINLMFKIGFAFIVSAIVVFASLKEIENGRFEKGPSPKLKQELSEDESILWYFRPPKSPFLMGILECVCVGAVAIAVLVYLASINGPIDGSYSTFIMFGSIMAGLFLLYGPYRIAKGSSSEYMITNRRLFFKTLTEYAFEELTNIMSGPKKVRVVSLEDVIDVYTKRGFHDRLLGTSTLYVPFKGFQRTTRSGGENLYHQPPSFAFIKDAQQVQKIIQEAAEKVQRNI